MPGNLKRSSAANLTAVAAGAVAGGLLGWLFAPAFFWGLLIGGALSAGAVRVCLVLFTADDRGPGGA